MGGSTAGDDEFINDIRALVTLLNKPTMVFKFADGAARAIAASYADRGRDTGDHFNDDGSITPSNYRSAELSGAHTRMHNAAVAIEKILQEYAKGNIQKYHSEQMIKALKEGQVPTTEESLGIVQQFIDTTKKSEELEG